MMVTSIETGWNLFGYTVPGSEPIQTGLASIDGEYASVAHYDAATDTWLLYDAVVGPPFDTLVNTLTELEFGLGYWIYATEPTTLYLGIGNEGEGRLIMTAPRPGDTAPPPATFYGWIGGADRHDVDPGDSILAFVDVELCGTGNLVQLGGRLAYLLQVEAKGDSGRACGESGKGIRFEVNGISLPDLVSWDNHKATQLDLSLPDTRNLYFLPLTKN